MHPSSSRVVRDRLTEQFGSLNVREITMDFERVMWRACSSVLPTVHADCMVVFFIGAKQFGVKSNKLAYSQDIITT